eukprot:scaffold29919_cov70-Cyclotella_meneghiniana.AAC.22
MLWDLGHNHNKFYSEVNSGRGRASKKSTDLNNFLHDDLFFPPTKLVEFISLPTLEIQMKLGFS